jgi:hypothetical protein
VTRSRRLRKSSAQGGGRRADGRAGVVEIVAGLAVALRDFGLMLGALTLARLASVYDPPGTEVRF